MPPDIHSYAVFGFSESLDWSTLDFVEPIDDIRVCSACGVVAGNTAFLPCRHVLCEPCYERWKPKSNVCVIDRELCPENEIHWMEFPAKKMMKRKVNCWNKANGCETITDVSSISEHFHRECEYHSACCPTCSSTVLRRDMIAHLESHCINYVLNRTPKSTQREDFSKIAHWLQESLRTLESEFINTSQNNASLLSSVQGITANDDENHNRLSTVAVDLMLVSQVTRQTLSEIERARERQVNQSIKFKSTKENFCTALAEIKETAKEWEPCNTTSHRESRLPDGQVEELQALFKEMQGLSTKLGELKNKVHEQAAHRKSGAVEALPEVLSFPALSYGVMWDDERIILNGFVRVVENTRKVPVKVLWCVDKWSNLASKIMANKFFRCDADVAVDHRYTIYLSIDAVPGDNKQFQFSVCVCETRWTILAGSPKKMKMEFCSRVKGGVEYDMQRGEREIYLSGCFSISDLEASGGVHNDALKVCFKLLY